MKRLTNFFLVILLIIFQFQPSFGQTPKVLKGVIMNRATGEKLAYASVYCLKDGIGTVSNENGEFRFSIPDHATDDTIYISFIGYEKKRILKEKISSDSIYKIFLKPIPVKLNEVTVIAKTKNFNEKRIIREAIKRIPDNYPVEPFLLGGYYRDYIRDSNYYCNLIEAAITVQDKGFKTYDYEQTLFQIKQIRNNPIFKFDTIENQLQYGKNKIVPYAVLGDFNGNEFWILRVHDPLRNYDQFSFSFIEKMKSQFLPNHHFKLDSIVYNGTEAFYSISFNSTKNALDYKNKVEFEINGRMLINKRTYGIFYIDYSVNCKSKLYSGLLFNVKLEYKEYNSKLLLNYLLFKNYFEFNSSNGFTLHDIRVDERKNMMEARFTQPIHPRLWKDVKLTLKIDDKLIATDSCVLKYDKVHIYCASAKEQLKTLTKDNEQRISIDFKNLISISKRLLDTLKRVGLFQYREFFVNETKTKNFEPIPLSELASKDIPLFQLNSKQDQNFWNSYNYFLRQPLKD